MLNYLQFIKQKPLPMLYGAIRMDNGQVKFGFFKAKWNKWSNTMCYQYYTMKGNKGAGGFNLAAAYNGYANGSLKVVNPGDVLICAEEENVIVPTIK